MANNEAVRDAVLRRLVEATAEEAIAEQMYDADPDRAFDYGCVFGAEDELRSLAGDLGLQLPDRPQTWTLALDLMRAQLAKGAYDEVPTLYDKPCGREIVGRLLQAAEHGAV